MKIEIFFIGTSATSPSVYRGLPSLAIRTNKLFLFDVGEGTQRQMMQQGVRYGSIDSIFISHSHLDHYLGLFGLLETLKLNNRKEKLTIYSPFSLPIDYEFVEFKKITKEGLLLEKEETQIYCFKTNHSVDSYGFILKEKDKRRFYKEKAHALGLKGRDFKIIEEKGYITKNGKRIEYEDITYYQKGKRIIYTSDTPFSKKTIEIAKDADLLIHDATFTSDMESEAQIRKHSTIEQAIEVAKQANVETLALTHFSTRYTEKDIKEDVKKYKKEYKGKIIIAKDGLRIEI